MATVAYRDVNSDEKEDLKRKASEISDRAPRGIVTDRTFVFWTGFDGTYNTKDNPGFSGDTQSTAVGSLYNQIEEARKKDNNQNLGTFYLPGPGAPGTLPGSALNPTDQGRIDAEKAYKNFAKEAYFWKKDNLDGEFAVMLAAYSRGAVPAAMFAQMLYEKGLVYTDPETGSDTVLVPPGQIGIAAGQIISPVTTGAQGNLNFPPGTNAEVVLAKNEQRILYTQNEYPDLQHHAVIGNHGDIGCSIDNGIGGVMLESYTQYFKNTGLSIDDPPDNRKCNGNQSLVVHRQTVDIHPDTIPNIFRRSQDAPLVTDMTGKPFETICAPDGGCTTSYENYKGDSVEIEKENGVTKSATVKADSREIGPDGTPRWELGKPQTEYYNYPPNYAPSASFGETGLTAGPEHPEGVLHEQTTADNPEFNDEYDEDYYMSYYPGR